MLLKLLIKYGYILKYLKTNSSHAYTHTGWTHNVNNSVLFFAFEEFAHAKVK